MLQVGEAITTAEQYAELPVGTIVRGTNYWLKTSMDHLPDQPPKGTWRRGRQGTGEEANNLSTSGDLTVIEIPLPGPPVGTPLHGEVSFHSLPVGTILGMPSSTTERYLKIGEDQYKYILEDGTDNPAYAGRVLTLREGHFNRSGGNLIFGYTGYASPPPLTVHQFKWQFRDNALKGAFEAGIGDAHVRDALTQLQVQDRDFPFGVGMKISQPYDRNRMPDGSVVYIGNPEQPEGFGMFVKKDGVWRHLLGSLTSMPELYPTTVALVEGEELHQQWLEQSGGPEETEAMAQFKADAWRVGSAKARERNWCGTFNAVMRRVGVDETCRVPQRVGDWAIGQEVTRQQARELPVGSILRSATVAEPGFALYVRDDSQTNTSRTRRLGGWKVEGGAIGHTDMRMTIQFIPGVEMQITLPYSDQLFTALPPGTLFTSTGGGTHRWIIAEDHRASQFHSDHDPTPADGAHHPRGFGTGSAFSIVSITS